MAISTKYAFLMYKATAQASSYTKLCDVKSIPDLGGQPESLDTTTLTDAMRTHINGIIETDTLVFEANYDNATYTTLKGLEGTQYDFAVWFGATVSGSTVTPSGTNGKFEFKGDITTYVNGGGVNEVVGMTISIAATTPITLGA